MRRGRKAEGGRSVLPPRQGGTTVGEEVEKEKTVSKEVERNESDLVLEDLQKFNLYKNSCDPFRSSKSSTDSESSTDGNGSERDEASDSSDSFDSSSSSEEDSKAPKKAVPRRSGRSDAVISRCPYPPAPVKKSKRRNHATAVTEQPDEAKQLLQLLRTRTTLCPAAKSVEDELSKTNPEFKLLRSAFDYIKEVNSVKTWMEQLRSWFMENPRDFLENHFKQSLKTSLRTQIGNEYFFFAEAIAERRPVIYSSWKTFMWMIVKRHPVWKKYDFLQLKMIFHEVGFSCLLELEDLMTLLLIIFDRLEMWKDELNNLIEKKLLLMKNYRILEAEIEQKSKKLDEFCYYGKKKLVQLFMAPYFKSSSMDFTKLVNPAHFVENAHSDALVNERKQKWTTKDISTLKKVIEKVMVDKQYELLMHQYNYYMSRITHRKSLGSELESEFCDKDEARSSSSKESLKWRPGRKTGSRRSTRNKTSLASDPYTAYVKRNYQIRGLGGSISVTCDIPLRVNDVEEWFQKEEGRLRKLTYENVMSNEDLASQIDWHKVAERMTNEMGKKRNFTDCRLVWLHAARPNFSNRHWTAAEVKKLMDVGHKREKPWQDIAKEFNHRTPYQCFFKFRNRSVQAELMKWDSVKSERIKDVLIKEGPKWNMAVEATLDPRATKHQVQERWKKSCDPIIRNGAFTRVEDCLLLLTIEKLRGFIQKEGHFGILMGYLPWRYETVWRERANSLFSNWIVPWTVEEDKMLLELARAQTGRRDWQKIAEHFTSFKNRKGCLTRHNILQKKIGNGPGQFRSVEEYHEAYSMTRYNVFQYKHLREVVEVLKRVLGRPRTEVPFPGLKRDRPPTEIELRWMVLDFSRDTVSLAVTNLEKYIKSRDSYWREWTTENGGVRKTFDRRKFQRNDPKSVASAVHIRRLDGLELIPEEQVPGADLTDFEREVYFYYARFRRTKALEKIERPCIPTAKKLCKLPEIARIVRLPLDHWSESDSGSDWDEKTVVRKRGRPPKVAKCDKVRLTSPSEDQSRNKSKGSLSSTSEDQSRKKSQVGLTSSSEDQSRNKSQVSVSSTSEDQSRKKSQVGLTSSSEDQSRNKSQAKSNAAKPRLVVAKSKSKKSPTANCNRKLDTSAPKMSSVTLALARTDNSGLRRSTRTRRPVERLGDSFVDMCFPREKRSRKN